MDLLGELRALVTYLNDEGVRADLDPARLNTPCVWVEVVTIEPDLLSGGGEVTIGLNLIVADSPYDAATANLADLLSQVAAAVDTEGDVTPQTVVMPDGSNCPSWLATMKRPYERTA